MSRAYDEEMFKESLQNAIDSLINENGCGNDRCVNCPLHQLYVGDIHLCDFLVDNME